MSFKNLICETSFPTLKYHDDMFEEEVKVVGFPYDDLFVDFRVFNGLQLRFMDEKIGEIREIMIQIANEHAQARREERLKKEKET